MAGVNLQAVDGINPMSEASISLAATGTPIAGVAGQTIRVYGLFLTVTTSGGTVQFTDGVTSFTGLMTFAAGGQLVLPVSGQPWFKCAAGNGFSVVLAASGTVSGGIMFTQSTFIG